jgi:hypothetical protein
MKSPLRLLGILITAVLLSLIIIGLAGCSPAKISAKAISDYKASSQFPSDCATQFPFQVTAGTTDTLTITNTVIDCDSATAQYEAYWNSVNAQQYNGMRTLADSIAAMQSALSVGVPTNRRNIVRCPPSIYLHRVDTIESTAKLTALQRQLAEAQSSYQSQLTALQSKLEKKTNTLKKRNKQAAFMGGLISIFAIYTFRHQLIGLFGNFFTLLAGLLRRKK